MTPGWRVLGLMLGLGGGLATAWLSTAPYGRGSADARIRLAWSGRPERIEHCRRLSDSELEGVPAHMRQRIKCEGGFASYRLTLRAGGAVLDSRILRGGGTRNDRPIHLLMDGRIAPGRHAVSVTLDRIETVDGATDSTGEGADSVAGADAASDREVRETEERSRARREALPRHLEWSGTLDLEAGDVALVTYDSDARALVLRRRSTP